MAKKFEISTIFRGLDKMTGPSKRIGNSLRGLRKQGRLTSEGFSRTSRSIKKAFRSTAFSIIGVSSALFAVKKLLVDSVSRTAEFGKLLTSAALKFPENIQKGTKAYEDLDKAARKVGATTEFTILQSASALQAMAQAGLTAKSAMTILPDVVNFATAASIGDLNDASTMISKSLGLFNLKTTNVTQLEKNVQRISDVFLAAANSSNTNVNEIFEASQKAVGAANNLKIPLEQVVALIASVSDQVTGGDAGVAIRNFLLQLSTAKKGTAAGKAMESLGIKIKKVGGGFRDVADIVDDFNKALAGKGTVQSTKLLNAIFLKRGIAGATALFKTGGDRIRSFEKSLKDAGGTTKIQAEIMRRELSVRFKVLISTFQSFTDTLTVKLVPAILSVTNSLIKMFDAFQNQGVLKTIFDFIISDGSKVSTSFKDWAVSTGLFVTALIAVSSAIKAVNVISNMDPFVKAFTLAWMATSLILANLDKIKAFFNDVKNAPVFKSFQGVGQSIESNRFLSPLVELPKTLLKLGTGKLGGLFSPGDNSSDSKVIDLPQNRNTTQNGVFGGIDVIFNNAPKNTEFNATKSNIDLNLSQSGAF